MRDMISLSAEVADALAGDRAVVALESTAIAHGLPAPANLEVAAAMERAVRDAGAVPAMIAALDGKLRIGLSSDDVGRLAGGDVAKVSRRDLPFALARGIDGATTVSTTMIAARMAGIAVFATGGIGGVHRGAENTFDVSADLEELARTDVCVVSSGAKSILDLPKTLEVLETLGVPVIGYGCDRFPGFYTRETDLPVDGRCDTPEEVARVMDVKWRMELRGAVLLANPIPRPAALDEGETEKAIAEALADAEAKGIGGKALTPHLLAHLHEATEGRTRAANSALLVDNARVGGLIAKAYAETRVPPVPQQRQYGRGARYY